MTIDENVRKYFDGNIKQVFIYITSRCQLRCKQCLYKPLLYIDNDIDYTILTDLLKVFYDLGARKVSFLGGEPTLYYDKINEKSLCDVIQLSKDIGYQLVRIDTNGQFDKKELENSQYKLLDEITFSIDGSCSKFNDYVRGKGTFSRCIQNVVDAVDLGYNVQITSCVHNEICKDIESGLKNIEDIIKLAESLGVASINFHPIFKVGISRDNWIEDTNIDPAVWIEIYKIVKKNIDDGVYKVNVRFPMRFAPAKVLLEKRENFFYCPLYLGERALIMPDGQIKICAFNIGTNKCIARYTADNIILEENDNERYLLNANSGFNVCCNQKDINGLVPLCMSFKPDQMEYVWNIMRTK